VVPFTAMASENQRTQVAFVSVRGRRVVEEVLDQIVEAVRLGDLDIGGRLPTERKLAELFEVSRPTVREAAKLLVDAGVLEANAGSGGGLVVLTDVIPSALLDERVDLRMGDVASVLEARRILEPRVAQLAAFHATADDIDALRRSISQQSALRHDRVRFNEVDARFHMLIARATHNSSVETMCRDLQRDLRISRDMSMRESFEPDQSIAMHVRTVDAIVRGDEREIETVMDEHLALLESLFESIGGRLRTRRPPSFLRRQA
jgi:GntR family transcriptional regulator, transcriptional repressor for pyruvate dehydrogenase complex